MTTDGGTDTETAVATTEPEIATDPDTAAAAGGVVVGTEQLPGSRVSLQLEASAADVDAAVAHALGHLARRYRFPGFRPGRAPAPVVERAAGWPAIASEAVEALVPSIYARGLDEAGLRPVGDPELTLGDAQLERGRPFRFGAVVTVSPTVDLGDYTALRVDRETTDVTDEDVDGALEEVRRRHGELVDVERSVQSGDVLRATLVMREGDRLLGGEGEERDVEVDRTELLPGLADALLGLEPGSSSSAELTLPDTYANEELRGHTVTIDITVHAVRQRKLPPLDDALAVLDGHGTTLDELRAHHRERLTTAAARRDDEQFEGTVLEELSKRATVDVPDLMIDREVDRQVRDMEMRLAQMGMQLERYLQYTGETMEALREQRRASAAERVRLELVLQALAEAEGLEIDEADVERQEASVIGDRKVTPQQRRGVHMAAHQDLMLRAAGQRALEIARGDV